MKYIILIFVFLIFCSCSPQVQTGSDKETIIKELPGDAKNISIINKVVYPEATPIVDNIIKLLPKGSLYAGHGNGYVDVDAVQVVNDKKNCKLYWENSYTVDGDTKLLDLSGSIGKKVCMVRLYFKVTDYGRLVNCTGYPDGSSTFAKIKFSTPGSNFIPLTLTQRLGDQYSCVDVITDTNGCVNMQLDVTSPYDAITEAADPGVHVYQWVKGEVWVYAKWDIDIVN